MDVLILGGTRFIGRAIVQRLLERGHRVTVMHRGKTPASGLKEVEIINWDRARFPERPEALAGRRFDALIDTCALEAGDVSRLLEAMGDSVGRYLMLSSADVYRAFGALLEDSEAKDLVPIPEDAPLRGQRFPYRDLQPQNPRFARYEKLDCEAEAMAGRCPAVVLRLPFVYGPNDYQRREWFALRRLRRRRPVVLGGGANWLGTRAYVGDVANAVELAATHEAAPGEIFFVGERRAPTLRQLALQIAEASGFPGEVISIPDPLLPPHLADYASRAQHMLLSSEKIRQRLGFREERDAWENLQETVRWHLANAPEETEEELRKEERAEDEAVARWRAFLKGPTVSPA